MGEAFMEIPSSIKKQTEFEAVSAKPSFLISKPDVTVTTEYDSDTSLFSNKFSCKLFDNLAKVKVCFQNNGKGEVSYPQVGFITKYLSVLFDPEEKNALVKGAFNLGSRLQFRASQDIKEQQGEVAMIACMADPSYKLELSSMVPSNGMPKATLRFPMGEVSLAEKEDEEVKRVLSMNGILRANFKNNVFSAQYKDDDLKLEYTYKDPEMTFMPTISLPSNVISFAFKRRFNPSDKFSYYYTFNSSQWSAIYKHTIGKDYKVKTGYDSGVRVGWASLWVGQEESGHTKSAPMKTKFQVMLQVPQDDISSSTLLFRVKKRWDF